jgi:poly-gamma-glutamate capsule biosynthesis protein CapA/YwtB (metallophosphatase superfamily)
MTAGGSLRLSAVGDISFEGPKADHPSFDCFRDVAQYFRQSDLVIGNLEGPLTDKGEPALAKCTLRASPDWAAALRRAGVNVVTLANNHLMDYGVTGLLETRAALDRAGIRHVGAGRNAQEACAPLVLEVAGRRVALLARSSVVVGARTYADEHQAGVAFLDENELIESIRAWKAKSDLVILLRHWGVEEHLYPSPDQRRLARRCTEAGADAILGHHPHVVQGIEHHSSAPIVYSLGNFVFSEFEWTYTVPGGDATTYLSTLTPENREGVIVTLEWTRGGSPQLTAVPTRIDSEGDARLDTEPSRQKRLGARSRRLMLHPYRLIWSIYAMRVEWRLRLASRISWGRLLRNVHRVRPHHVKELLRSIRRSLRIVLQKTTNPYE